MPAPEAVVKGRIIVLVISAVISSVSAGIVAAGPQVSTVQAGADLTAPLEATVAMTSTTFLPLVMNCYPRLGPDPYFSDQYDMSLVNADAAWGLCNLNASGVTIAIVDTGVDLTHPDLQANLLPGYDFVDHDVVPQDGNGHGTNVAGIAAAALDGVGVEGRLVIAAAGNCGDSNYILNGCSSMNQPVYPAAYSNVMAVAATTAYDTRASFSNVGSYVDIGAPGVSIYNAYYGNSYIHESGTSQASPHVAGLAALVWAKNPGYTASQVWNRMTSTAVDLGTPGVDTSFGAGRIDVKQALRLTLAQVNTTELGLAKADPVALVDQRTAPLAVGRIIVKFKDTVSQDSLTQMLAERSDVTLDKSIAAIDAVVLDVPVGAEWRMIDQLRAQADVEYAEPDYTLHLLR